MIHVIKKGLDLPIRGAPRQEVVAAPAVKTVALLAADYHGMKPTMEVAEGDRVKLGQVLFTDKKNDGVRFTSPGAGKVLLVNRGDKRVFHSVVVELDGAEEITFGENDPAVMSGDDVRKKLLESGLWTALRRRPYSKVPAPSEVPHSVFVTAIDSNPLAADPAPIVAAEPAAWRDGLTALTKLTEGWVHLCRRAGSAISDGGVGRVLIADFQGPHPSGLPGTHIHALDPVSSKKPVWYVGYQDVIAIGKLVRKGRLDVTRVISLAGPRVKDPRLLRTRVGANIEDLVKGQTTQGQFENRVISGSVLSGRQATAPNTFLGRYHQQISVLEEGRGRELLGWHMPGANKFSVKKVFLSAVQDAKDFDMNTNTGGSPRAMVPVGSYEQVMPLDILPTYLLRSLIIGDTDQAQLLGALELDEEDLALCTFVCPGKYEYGPMLRKSLQTIEREG